MKTTVRSHRFLLLLFAVGALLLALVVAPMVGSLFAAGVFAVVLHPLQTWLAARLGDRPRISAAAVTAGLAVVVLLPLSWLSVAVVRQLVQGIGEVVEVVEQRGIDGVFADLPDALRPYADRLEQMLPAGVLPERRRTGDADAVERPPTRADAPVVAAATRDDVSAIGSLLATTATVVRALLGGLLGFLVELGVLVVALYFLLAEGAALVAWVVGTAPLPDRQMQRFVGEFRDVTVAVFVSTVTTAALQAAIAAVGYLLAGVPHLAPLLLLTFVAAFVPAIGGAIVVVATGALQVLLGDIGWGIFLIVWGIVAVGLCDNLAKPMLARRTLRLPTSVLFFAMLGGLATFGVMGVIAGPLILSFFLVVTRALGAAADHQDGEPAAERNDRGDEAPAGG